VCLVGSNDLDAAVEQYKERYQPANEEAEGDAHERLPLVLADRRHRQTDGRFRNGRKSTRYPRQHAPASLMIHILRCADIRLIGPPPKWPLSALR
jgi:hypothetical protein